MRSWASAVDKVIWTFTFFFFVKRRKHLPAPPPAPLNEDDKGDKKKKEGEVPAFVQFYFPIMSNQVTHEQKTLKKIAAVMAEYHRDSGKCIIYEM